MKKYTLFIIAMIFLTTACEQKTDETNQPVESMNAGDLTVYCENIAFEMMDTVFGMYDQAYEKVNLAEDTVNSREAMKLLLSGDARVIVISRDYLKDEDSLMKAYDVDKHVRLKFAEDAIVIFSNPDFPLDTLSEEEVRAYLTSESQLLSKNLEKNPEIVTFDYRSSVYTNIGEVITKGKGIKRKLTMINDLDSLRDYVLNNDNTIAIAYLSHVVNEPKFKMIRIGFTNKDGKREAPQVVHQSYILVGRYPWKISHYAYLLEGRKNLPYWFATYLSKETVAQKYFLKFGIIPTYAQLELVPQG